MRLKLHIILVNFREKRNLSPKTRPPSPPAVGNYSVEKIASENAATENAAPDIIAPPIL